jgi:hypothetical protein
MDIGCHPVWVFVYTLQHRHVIESAASVSYRRRKLLLELSKLPGQSVQASEAGIIPVPECILLCRDTG